MTHHLLVAHGSDEARNAVHSIVARVGIESRTTVVFEYRLDGAVDRLAVPRRAEARRADRLWERTCFEAFVAPAAGSHYCELNFSPSTEWAAYAFDAYREGMRPLALPKPPSVAVVETEAELRVTAAIDLAALPEAPWPWRIGLTAVVEDRAGSRAYFALRHPRQNPDFHDVAGFTASLDEGAR
jgi:hypothetical protein